MKVRCDFCKQEFCATPYLFNHAIKKQHNPFECHDEFLAKCDARFLCNFCGQIFVKNFSREIFKSDIERIALGERSNENAE